MDMNNGSELFDQRGCLADEIIRHRKRGMQGTHTLDKGSLVGRDKAFALRETPLSLFDAATCGVYLHSQAGEAVGRELGDAGIIASDLLPALPRVIKGLRERARMPGKSAKIEI